MLQLTLLRFSLCFHTVVLGTNIIAIMNMNYLNIGEMKDWQKAVKYFLTHEALRHTSLSSGLRRDAGNFKPSTG